MENLSEKQKGVAINMAIGIIVAIAVVLLPDYFLIRFSLLKTIALSVLIPAIFVMICIARLAKHRFFTPEDIDGSGLTNGTAKAKELQAILQNTLEQSFIAICVYLASLYIGQVPNTGSVAFCLLAFCIGRILFFIGYAKGAVGRALGFTLTFYPTVVLAITNILILLNR